MPKIKIKDFKGIFTNLDENDNRLEAVRDSINFYHKRGFLEFIPRNLQARADMPETNGGGFYYNTFELETGIYTTLTSDRLTTNITATPRSYDVLVIISKVVDSGTTHRLIHLFDGTDWWELSNYSSPNVGGVRVIDLINASGDLYANSMISTTLSGTPFFQVEDGRLKIYMPHCAFWVGRIERKIWIKDNAQRWPYTDPGSGVISYPYFNYEAGYWYIDRLTDFWDYDKQYIQYEEDPVEELPTGYIPIRYQTAMRTADYEGRRLGIYYKVSLNTSQTATVGETAITIGGLHDNKIRTDKYRGINCWTTRNNIVASDTNIGVTCPWKPFESDPTIFTFPIDTTRNTHGWDFENNNDIQTNSGQYSGIYILFDEYAQSLFRKYDDDTWTWAGSVASEGWVQYPNGITCEFPAGLHPTFQGIVYSLSYQNFLDFTWAYLGDQQIQDIGYNKTTDKKFGIIATMVLDDREEIPVRAREYSFTPTDKFAIDIKGIDIPYDISKRVTRLRFYHRIKDGSDFEMVKEFDFLNEDGRLKDFSFTDQDKSGDTLAGNTGYLWDLWKRPNDLKIVQGFRSFMTESGISIGLATYDLVSIFHSTFGGGSLQPDLIYDDNRIPISGVAKLTAVGNADGRLMAFTDNTAYAIDAEEVAGVIGFRIEDTVELGVKNQQDIANIQGGVAVHTIHGIYITNGFETQSISEPIDNVIVTNYNTGKIFYNRYKHILYYKPTNAEDLYQFRFKDAVWEKINKTTSDGEVEQGEVD
jgi:hypothetical protein